MGAERRFHWLDVFTDAPFSGNQLAVVVDADGLTDQQMQQIARELNLSETVFVLPPTTDALRRLRIFTPATELPYAGHPTIGTAVLLAELGVTGGQPAFTLEEAAGTVHVTVNAEAAGPWSATLTAPQPLTVAAAPPSPEVAALLSLPPDDLDPGRPPAIASVGVAFLLVGVRSEAALARARIDAGVWEQLVKGRPGEHVYAFCGPAGGAITARMFAPAMGVEEDPATGAAASALGGHLAAVNGASGSWTISQGAAVGRPSRLDVAADVEGANVVAVRVGGQAVRIAEGVLRVP